MGVGELMKGSGRLCAKDYVALLRGFYSHLKDQVLLPAVKLWYIRTSTYQQPAECTVYPWDLFTTSMPAECTVYPWGLFTTSMPAECTVYPWDLFTTSMPAECTVYPWGLFTTSMPAECTVYPWGLFTTSMPAECTVYPWGLFTTSMPAVYPWGLFTTSMPAECTVYPWGLFTQHLQSNRMHIIEHSLRSHCTSVRVKPNWIQTHLNPLREVVLIRIEVNPFKLLHPKSLHT